MQTITKALVGTVAAGAMAMASATPAFAQSRDRDDGIDAGDVIAGALIIGGIAAVAAAVDDDDDRYRGDYRYNNGRYNGGYYNNGRYYNNRGYNNGYYNQNPRNAVEQCVRTAESNANRYSYGGRAKVTDIRDIDRDRDGYTIKGRIAVNQQGRAWRYGDSRYGRGWDNDYRGWNDNYRGYDSGKFTCKIRYGRVVGLDYDGIRGLS